MAYLRTNILRSPDAQRIGPFLARFDRDSDNAYRNYAIPDDDSDATEAEVDALIAAFRDRKRMPRFEFAPEIAPLILPRLEQVGFRSEGTLPLLECTESAFRPSAPPNDFLFSLATGNEDLRFAALVQNDAYGQPGVSDADVHRLEGTVEKGGAVVLARESGSLTPAGAGLYSPPLDGTTEIAALGVRPLFRRRGVGAHITTILSQHAFRSGINQPFLMAAQEAEARLYARIGFEVCGMMLHTSLKPASR